MEIETFITNLKLFIKNENFNNFEFYIFGSSLFTEKFEDIDILIIYTDFDILKILKKKMLTDFDNYLLHIICLTKKEEVELTFIQKVTAIKIE